MIDLPLALQHADGMISRPSCWQWRLLNDRRRRLSSHARRLLLQARLAALCTLSVLPSSIGWRLNGRWLLLRYGRGRRLWVIEVVEVVLQHGCDVCFVVSWHDERWIVRELHIVVGDCGCCCLGCLLLECGLLCCSPSAFSCSALLSFLAGMTGGYPSANESTFSTAVRVPTRTHARTKASAARHR